MLAKCEFFNPLSSVKDRIGVAMIEAAERDGKIDKDTVIVEPTSGNTGIALAFVCAAKGYKLILTMPEIDEHRAPPAAQGARGRRSCSRPPPTACAARSTRPRRSSRSTRRASCRSSSRTRPTRRSTARRPPRKSGQDTDGKVDILVAGVGTGGTITGVAEVIKPRKPSFKAIAVEPVTSPVITQTMKGEPIKPGRHKIQGIGAGFVPGTCTLNIVDEVIQITDEEAFEWARRLHKEEGIFGGISSGGNMAAAAKVAARPENKGKMIVVICPASASGI